MRKPVFILAGINCDIEIISIRLIYVMYVEEGMDKYVKTLLFHVMDQCYQL